jgi:hypothetical protein
MNIILEYFKSILEGATHLESARSTIGGVVLRDNTTFVEDRGTVFLTGFPICANQ